MATERGAVPELRPPLSVLGARAGADVPGRRNVPRMAAGLMLVVICGLGALVLFRGADHRRPVLVVTAQVAPGQALTADDVAVVNVVVGPQVHTVAAGELGTMVGRKAVFGLTPGSLLDPGALTTGPALDPSQVLMGVSLKAGFFPSSVKSGDNVVVLVVAGTSSNPSGASPLGDGTRARVVDVRSPAANSGDTNTTVDLAVARSASQAIAAAAAANQVVLAVAP